MQETTYFISLVLWIGIVNFSINAVREASGIVCSHGNPYLPTQAPTT